jgi:hypothetical protein
MQQFFSLLSWRLITAQHVSGVFPPIIRSLMTAVAASGFTFVSWWQSCCVRGRAGRPATHMRALLNGAECINLAQNTVQFKDPVNWQKESSVLIEVGNALTNTYRLLKWTPSLTWLVNPLNSELNSICRLLVLLGNLTFVGTCIVNTLNKNFFSKKG